MALLDANNQPHPVVRAATANASLTILSCPYLSSADRGWVSTGPAREHRCEAVTPAAALSLEKQRRLCLTADHESCATYGAAIAAREARGDSAADGALGWGWVRTTPVVDRSMGAGASLTAIVTDRRGWQVIPAVVLVVALGALGLSNIGAGGGPASPSAPLVADTSPTASGSFVTATPTLTETPSPSPSASSAASATPTIAPSPVPSPTPAASAQTTYVVKAGDTLFGIGQKFGVSVKAIQTLNGLTSTSLHVGQILKIP